MPHEANEHLKQMLKWLEEEASARGATHPPKLRLREMDLGEPVSFYWVDGTYNFLKTF
jgi:hypothetical protein